MHPQLKLDNIYREQININIFEGPYFKNYESITRLAVTEKYGSPKHKDFILFLMTMNKNTEKNTSDRDRLRNRSKASILYSGTAFLK